MSDDPLLRLSPSAYREAVRKIAAQERAAENHACLVGMLSRWESGLEPVEIIYNGGYVGLTFREAGRTARTVDNRFPMVVRP